MRDLITTILEDSIRVKRQAIEAQMDALLAAADMLVTCVASGHKILLFGNGGSAADAQHLAAEFVNRFQIERHPLPALALTTDTSIITSIGNDYTFEQIFSKQIQALGKRGDVAWGLSTSGNSPNVLAGMRAARELGLRCLGMTGQGGALTDASDLVLTVPTATTARVQETHIIMGHMLCQLVDETLFPPGAIDSSD
ncbi:MAG: D-sedoheptulose 7-phosphate isomerase [Desulfobacteraceae bacterium]|nr:D-sedoheptulose 7-phosphate isomerase [Desulfobacteraceae bacterium]MBC2749980.1 D-sedoheptulose 7-phosphate isomerase [Desulfobacteraceae bacterium]